MVCHAGASVIAAYDHRMPATSWASGLPLGLLGFGLLLVVIGLVTLTRDRQRRESWQSHPGRVVASRLDDGHCRSRVTAGTALTSP